MIKKEIKNIRNKIFHTENILRQNQEIIWGLIYRDSIRGKICLEKLSLSPGRWAANYSFLYVLIRILSDYKPKKILEFGLGESSKLVSTFIENELTDSEHIIVEHSVEWIEEFKSRFLLSNRTHIVHLELEEQEIEKHNTNAYKGIVNRINEKFDLYIIDGPFGSKRFSRYDICLLAHKFEEKDEFIIIFDDFDRQGEKDTVKALIAVLNSKHIEVFVGTYSGTKEQAILVTKKYKFALSF